MGKNKVSLVRKVRLFTKASNTYGVYDEWDWMDEEERAKCLDVDAEWFGDYDSAMAYFTKEAKNLTSKEGDTWHTYNGLVLGCADADEDNVWDDGTWEEFDYEFAWADYGDE